MNIFGGQFNLTCGSKCPTSYHYSFADQYRNFNYWTAHAQSLLEAIVGIGKLEKWLLFSEVKSTILLCYTEAKPSAENYSYVSILQCQLIWTRFRWNDTVATGRLSSENSKR